MKNLKHILIIACIFFIEASCLSAQNKFKGPITYQAGFTYFLLEEDDLSGGGLGCWGGNGITNKNANFSFNLGVGISLASYKGFTLNTSGDLIYINSSNHVEGGFSCLFGKVSDSNGVLKFNTFAFRIPVILSYRIPHTRFSVDAGIYAFLPFSKAKFTYIYRLYVDYSNYTILPEPIITNEVDKINSSITLGLSFGLGFNLSKDNEHSKIKISYQRAFNPTLELSESDRLRFNGLEVKLLRTFD